MKSVKIAITLWLLCLFAGMPVGATTRTMTYTLSFSPSDFTVQTINGDTSIITSTKYSLYSEYDSTLPELPVIYVTLLLPRDASYAGFTYTKVDNPFQPGVILKNGSKPCPNSISFKISSQNQWYPSQIYPSSIEFVQTISLPGYRMITFKVKPIRYNAILHDLMIADYNLCIQLNDAEIQPPSPSKRGASEREYIENKIWNPDSLLVWYNTEPQSTNPAPNIDSPIPKDQYLIITNRAMKEAFRPLENWKKQKGLDASIVLIDSILPILPLPNAPDILKNFLKNWYESKENRDSIDFYVLLGGDVSSIPIYTSSVSSSYNYDNYIPCDMYYACFHNLNWYYGELTSGTNDDLYPYKNDIYVTRAAVEDSVQAATFVNKIIQYETNPPLNWGDTLLFIGNYMHDYNDDLAIGTYMIDSCVTNESICKYIFFSDTNLYPYTSNETRTVQTAEQLSKNYSFVSEMSHGSHEGWLLGNSLLDTSIADTISSTYPKIIVTAACFTNEFDTNTEEPNNINKSCLSEAFMRNPNSGIVAYVGSSREGYGVRPNNQIPTSLVASNAFQKDFTYGIYKYGTLNDKNLGKIVEYAKNRLYFFRIADKSILLSINTLGDPEMPIFTQHPLVFDNISCLLNSGTDTLIINTGISNTKLHVITTNKLYQSLNGNYSIPISNLDSLEFVLTKQNYIPIKIKYYRNKYIQNETILQNTTYKSNCGYIFLGRNVSEMKPYGPVTIASGKELKLKAQKGVMIKNGFKVESGGTFEMDIE